MNWTFWSLRLLIIIIFLSFFYSPFCANQLMRIHIFNAGYADALIIQWPDGQNWMIDAGEEESSKGLAEYIQFLGIKEIDTAIITHPHQNHFEGFKYLLKEVSIKRLFINADENGEEGYQELLTSFVKKKISVDRLSEGKMIDRLPGGIDFKILHPRDELFGNANSNSIVSLIRYQQSSLLLFADVEVQAQEGIFARYPEIKDVDCIQIPHHGGPISPRFKEMFVDKKFFISTGENKWGWPKAEELNELQGDIFRTDRDGIIIFESDGINWTIKTQQ